MTYFIATLVLVLLAYGLIKRHQRSVHIPVMSLAFAIDFCLVLYVEISRHAVEKALTRIAEPLLWIHVSASVGTLVLYIVLGYLGFQILQKRAHAQPWHRRLSYYFICFRLINYVTSFWIPQ